MQDKVGQGEVDIPAREMLADLLLESGHAKDALAEYQVALRLSPNRLNGLYNAAQAARSSGDREHAQLFYTELLASAAKNADRPEVKQARSELDGAVSAASR
jgi:tetratricopeptide (TPR) repeat protein